MSFKQLLGPLGFSCFAALAALGCSDDGDDDGSSSGTTSASLDAACEQFATTVCARFTECVPSSFVDSAYDCKSIQKRGCLAGQTSSSNVQPSDIDACGDTFGAASCSDLTIGVLRCTFPAGDVANGSACKNDTDCTSSFCAKGNDTCGTCAVPPEEGAACIQVGCGPARSCKDGQRCVTPKKSGEACGPSDSCLGGLDCVNGVCAAPADTEGAACDPKGVTAPRCNLLKALYCGEQSKKCLSVTAANLGEPCGLVDGQVFGCTLSYRCQVADKALSGTCVAKVDLDGACPKGDECKPGLSCKGSKCVDESSLTCP